MMINLENLATYERELMQVSVTENSQAIRTADFVFKILGDYYNNPDRTDSTVQEMLPVLVELRRIGVVTGIPEEESK